VPGRKRTEQGRGNRKQGAIKLLKMSGTMVTKQRVREKRGHLVGG